MGGRKGKVRVEKEVKKLRGTDVQTWTQRHGENLRDEGAGSEKVRDPQRETHRSQGDRSSKKHHM